jgi:parallel beta-helix repeat protein
MVFGSSNGQWHPCQPGHARLNLIKTTIDNCALHGICTRGNTNVSLINCTITNSGVRGIYAYHNATLSLARTTIEGTRDVLGAAVQIEALRSEDFATLLMDNASVIRNNRGEDLKVSGRVDRKMI